MAEELSPESKLYVKEEIEKSKKEFKDDLKEVQSKATRTFSTVAMIVGLVTGVGVYLSINSAIQKSLKEGGITKLTNTADACVQSAKKAKDKIADYETEASGILSSLSSKMIIGTIVPYGGEIKDSEEPTEIREGWYFCNGALLNLSDYPLLYKVIGRSFGGAPDSDTFNLPDLRGRFVRGVDHGSGRDPNANDRGRANGGGNRGDKVGSIQEDAFKKHDHQTARNRINNTYQLGTTGTRYSGGGRDMFGEGGNLVTGYRGGAETRPKNVYVNWIIKAE